MAQVVERLLSTPEIPGLNTVFGNLFTFNCIKKTKLKKKWPGGGLVYWLWETTRVREVVGSNPDAI